MVYGLPPPYTLFYKGILLKNKRNIKKAGLKAMSIIGLEELIANDNTRGKTRQAARNELERR